MGYERIRDHDCTECNQHSALVLRDRKSTTAYRLENPAGKEICTTRIDNCYINQGKRCDWLLVDCVAENAYFVELKGADFRHAIEQINATIDHLEGDLDCFGLFARVVLTKSPTPFLRNTPDVLKFEKRLRKRRGNLKMKTKHLEESV